MKKLTAPLSFVVSVVLLVAACKRDTQRTELPYTKPDLPATPFNYAGELPFSLGSPISNEKATLGRVLFYDKHLSFNNAVSCGSCHKQENAFADDKRFSEGFIGEVGTRNTPAIFNLSPTGSLFWDTRSSNLREMVLMPVKHREEMGLEDIKVLESKLAEIPYYADLFKQAFGSEKITVDKISEALSQFLLSIRATKSPYDKYNAGNKTELNNEEEVGMDLYFKRLHCQQCHRDANIGVYYQPSSFNIGLDYEYKDVGVMGITNRTQHEGFFKAPQLRNLAFTAPYMHDGRFATLEEVVEHYNSGVVNHPNLSQQLKVVTGHGWGNNNSGQVVRNKFGMPTLELTETEKKQLVAFLKAMSDYSMVKDIKYSDPFKY